MNLLASNLIWVPLCLLALGLILWDWKVSRRYILATTLALSLSGAAVFAAEVRYEWCDSVCPYVGPITWWIVGCYVCD